MKLSDGGRKGELRSVRLSKKLGMSGLGDQCMWELAPPATPSSPASVVLGVQPLCFHTVLPVSIAHCLASPVLPFQTYSPVTHTRTLSAVAAPLFTSRVLRPATSQTQRNLAREGWAPGSGWPLREREWPPS